MEGKMPISYGLYGGGSFRKKPKQDKNDSMMVGGSSSSSGEEPSAVAVDGESVFSDVSVEDPAGGDLFEGKRFFIHTGVSNSKALEKEIRRQKGTIQKEPIANDDDAYNVVEEGYTPPIRYEHCNFVKKDLIIRALNDGVIPADIGQYVVHHKKEHNDILSADVIFEKSTRGKTRTKMYADRAKTALMPQEDRKRLPHTIQLALFHQDARNYNVEIQLQALAASLGHGLTNTSLRGARTKNPCPFVYTIGTGSQKHRGYKNHLSMVKYLMRSLDFPEFQRNLIHFESELNKHRRFSGKRYNDDLYRTVVRVITEELPTGWSPQKVASRICDYIDGMNPGKLQSLFDSKWSAIVRYIASETGLCADLKASLLPDGVTDDELFSPSVVFPTGRGEEEEEEEDEASLFFRDDHESFYDEKERIRLSEIQRISEEPSSYVSVESESLRKRPVEEVAETPAKRQRQASISGSSTSSSEAYYDALDFSQPIPQTFTGTNLPEPPSQIPDYTLPDDTMTELTFTNRIMDDPASVSQVTQAYSQVLAPDSQSQDGQRPNVLDDLDDEDEFTMDMFNEYSKRFTQLYPDRDPEILAYCGFLFGRVPAYIKALDNNETPTGHYYFNGEELREMEQLVKEEGDPATHFFLKDERVISRLEQFFKLYKHCDEKPND
ncbi:hypothetical protein TRICI_000224 [Trichomonascus ciferrii]|uniref:Uncharacterized protein n=1 Tax=Trichomonascus ciferrii TaxID=44093 RepID=A0A642VE23_9ASCO|nr:hypothetical protein TRICI_000224 [Trichomonascus ciferrii]